MEVKELLCLLEDRLVQHDNNRKEVQDRLQDIYTESIKEADLLEERLNEKLQQYFNDKEERILSLIDKLNNNAHKDDLDSLTTEALKELSTEPKFEVKHIKNADNFVNSYDFKIDEYVLDVNIEGGNDNRNENIIKQLYEHLDKVHEKIISVQSKIANICTNRRIEAENLKKKIDGELEEKFNIEDSHLQTATSELRENNSTIEDVFKAIQRAKTALLVRQSYKIEEKEEQKEKSNFYFMNMYELKIERNFYLKAFNFEERKPLNLISSFTNKGEFSLSFAFFSGDEIEIMKATTIKLTFKVTIKIWEKDKSEEDENSKIIIKECNDEEKQFYFYNSFYPSTTYCLKMRIKHQELFTQWSEIIEFTTPDFKDLCVWKQCPDYVDEKKKYSVDEMNPRIATSITNYYCTIIGNTLLPLNKVISWNIKILKSRNINGSSIIIGVAPFDINQNNKNIIFNCGWYFDCYFSSLYSGPPHNYMNEKYGPRKKNGEYIQTGDSVGVIMDTTKGELSFVMNKIKYGVSYEGIPLDKPLVPCVVLENKGDSVELDTSEVKESKIKYYVNKYSYFILSFFILILSFALYIYLSDV